LGEAVKTCFDLFRGALLEKYGLVALATLAEEREMWRNLTRFIDRGEAFYYPLKPGGTTAPPARPKSRGLGLAGLFFRKRP
jgi:hypothetical protein